MDWPKQVEEHEVGGWVHAGDGTPSGWVTGPAGTGQGFLVIGWYQR